MARHLGRGVLFAVYHLRFQGFSGLVPVALALGFIAWRTGSIVPAMAVHAGFNAIATLLLIGTSFLPARGVSAIGGMLLLPRCPDDAPFSPRALVAFANT